MSSHTTLYRLFDVDGALLYIGIAGNPGRRFDEHAGSKPWWGQVVRTELAHYPTRSEAAQAERQAIKVERPRHNVAHQAKRPSPEPPAAERAAPVATELIPGVDLDLINRARAYLPANRALSRAIDDPAKLLKAARIVRGALDRAGLTLGDLQ